MESVVVVFVGQVEAHHRQLVDDLFQGLAAQVADLHHLVLRLGDQILHGVDVGALEAVEAADGEIQLLDGQLQHLVPLGLRLLHHGGLAAHVLREVGEQREVVAQDLGAQGHGVPGGDGPVGPHLQRQLVKVAGGAHTGGLHRVVDLVDRGVDGVHSNDADHVLLGLVPVGGHIAPAVGQGDLHVQRGAVVQRGDVHVGVQNLHLAVGLDVAGRDLAGTHRLDVDRLARSRSAAWSAGP